MLKTLVCPASGQDPFWSVSFLGRDQRRSGPFLGQDLCGSVPFLGQDHYKCFCNMQSNPFYEFVKSNMFENPIIYLCQFKFLNFFTGSHPLPAPRDKIISLHDIPHSLATTKHTKLSKSFKIYLNFTAPPYNSTIWLHFLVNAILDCVEH